MKSFASEVIPEISDGNYPESREEFMDSRFRGNDITGYSTVVRKILPISGKRQQNLKTDG